jgi:hypothetical protein
MPDVAMSFRDQKPKAKKSASKAKATPASTLGKRKSGEARFEAALDDHQ